ncbi:MAG: exo-alpha-sialidase [Cellvibrio sp.]
MREISARAASTQSTLIFTHKVPVGRGFTGRFICATLAPKARQVLLILGACCGLAACQTLDSSVANSVNAVHTAPSINQHPSFIAAHILDEQGSYAQAHSASLTETVDGRLLATWFAGTHERHPDVKIYLAEFNGHEWSQGRVVATGEQADGTHLPTWNPVLFSAPDETIWLFYKVGPNPREWWGEVKISKDGGRTFEPAQRLPEGILGPIKNKLHITEMGSWLAPSSREDESGWTLVFETSRDGGKTWFASAPVASPAGLDAIQPSILEHADGRLQSIARTRQGVLASSFSADRGLTWSPLFALAVPNPSSGTDAVTLADGRHLLIYNPVAHSPETPGKGVRYPLALAVSHDGLSWTEILRLEQTPLVSGYAYPAIIQTQDGLLHIAYTLGRKRIKHVTLDPRRF